MRCGTKRGWICAGRSRREVGCLPRAAQVQTHCRAAFRLIRLEIEQVPSWVSNSHPLGYDDALDEAWGYAMLVKSVRTDQAVLTSGFENAESYLHMIEWLGQGDFPGFLINDVETELYAQDVGSRLVSVVCGAGIKPETKLRVADDSEDVGYVEALSVIFPLNLTVAGGNGVQWLLDIEAGYHATGMNVPDGFALRFDFNVIEARASG